MFKKTDIPVLGVIENMSFILDKNNNPSYPFGKNGAKELCEKQNIKLLDQIKIDESFNDCVEKGLVFENLSNDIKIQFETIAKEILS